MSQESCLSNFQLRLVCAKLETLNDGLKIALKSLVTGKVEFYKTSQGVFYLADRTSTAESDWDKFPCGLNADQVFPVITAWLDKQDPIGDLEEGDGEYYEAYYLSVETKSFYNYLVISKAWGFSAK